MRFTIGNDLITITLTRINASSAFIACIFLNGSHSNESQYSVADNDVHVTNITYEQSGLHNVFSMVWNQLSLEFIESSILVAQALKIENLTITMDSYNVETNLRNVKFYMRAFQGYVSSCTITYGDGTNSTVEKTLIDFVDTIENDVDIDSAVRTDPGLEHDFIKPSVYSNPGLHHIHVACENEINSANYSKTIVVQDAIDSFYVFPIPPHEFGMPITVVWRMEKGTNVTVEIWYNDVLCNTINTTFTNNQNNSCDCLVNNVTHYDPDNVVDIELKAWNLVSNISETVSVQIFQPMVITSLVALTSTAPWGSGVPGVGPNQNKFPAEHPVILKANYTGGPATSHYWKLFLGGWYLVCSNCGSRTSSSIENDFNFEPGDTDLVDVEIVPSNPAGTAHHSITIDIDRSFSLLSATINSPAVVNSSATLNIELGDIGAHTCVAVDFGDNSNTLLYGDSKACDEQYNYTLRSDIIFKTSELNTTIRNTTSIMVNHVFKTMGTYQVKLEGKNYVSSDSFEQEVVVANRPCAYPIVTITGNVQ
jgi:hypothetical protein